MNTEDLKELIINAQRRRFEQVATAYAANPVAYDRRGDLDLAADAYHFITNMDDDRFEECNFEDQPIGKINEIIDTMVESSKSL